eukprot:10537068-Alexandrium_andersonii.AAC.1
MCIRDRACPTSALAGRALRLGGPPGFLGWLLPPRSQLAAVAADPDAHGLVLRTACLALPRASLGLAAEAALTPSRLCLCPSGLRAAVLVARVLAVLLVETARP